MKSYGILSGQEIAEAVARHKEYLRLQRKDEIYNAGSGKSILGWWERRRMHKLSQLPRIHIDDFSETLSHAGGNLGTNSYDLNIANTLLVYDVPRVPAECDNVVTDWTPYTLDMRRENPTRQITIPEKGYVLKPGQLYLGQTQQFTETFNLVPNIDGRSSVGRLGLACHVTAGRGDCAFSGAWTLELFVIQPVRLYPGAKICQISFQTIKPGSRGYSGRYQNSKTVVASRFYQP